MKLSSTDKSKAVAELEAAACAFGEKQHSFPGHVLQKVLCDESCRPQGSSHETEINGMR
jgi:hypothetical protein